MPGLVACLRFTGPTTVAILVEQPTRRLELWDVTQARRLRQVDLAPGPNTPSKNVFPYMLTDTDRTDLHFNYPRAMTMLSISPGGKYPAVASATGVQLIALDEAKILGELPLPETQAAFDSYLGMSFPPAGDELWITHRAATANGQTLRLVSCRVADGTVRLRQDFTDMADGPLWVHPDRRSFTLSGIPRTLARWVTPDTQPRLDDLEKNISERYLPAWSDPIHRDELVLSLPDQGPVLVLRQPGYKNAGDITVPTLLTLERDVNETGVTKKTRLNGLGLPKRPVTTPVDHAAIPVTTPQPPAAWVALPAMAAAPPLLSKLGRHPWPSAWGQTHALTLEESPDTDPATGVTSQRIVGRLIELREAGRIGEPFTILPWAVLPEDYGFSLANGNRFVVGLQRDGARIVHNDPTYPERAHVITADGGPVRSFAVGPGPASWLIWTDFDAQDRVLTLADGRVTAWSVDGNGVQGVYALAGDYTTPAVLSQDRTLLAVSRGGSFDLIETATGNVVNRCAVGVPGFVNELAIAPDGHSLAALYTESTQPSDMQVLRGVLTRGGPGTPVRLVVWDGRTGAARVSTNPVDVFGSLAWIDHEHLAICGAHTMIYDLKLGMNTLSVKADDVPPTGLPIYVGPDGRVWHAVAEPTDAAQSFAHHWRTTAVHTASPPEWAPYLDPERAIFDVDTTPLRVELDIGDERQGKVHAQSLLASLQRHGCRIGPGGAVLRVTASVAGTGDYIEFKQTAIEIPMVAYALELRDAQGRELWRGASSGSFLGDRSRYVTKVDYETRVTNGGTTFIDFQGKDPVTAIVDEIIESGRKLEIPSTMPRKILRGAGQYVPPTRELTWANPAPAQ
jgi:hypothetical protein